MKKYNFFKTDGRRPSQEQLLDTKLFYQNAPEIYARFDEWNDNDRFYFIPLYLQMTYSCGWVAEMAPDPVWLGSFVKTTLEHPELFHYSCPDCGKVILPHRYCGSPLSGVVHLEGRCNCGWHGYEKVRGWRDRAVLLRERLENDRTRYRKHKLLHFKDSPFVYSVEGLLNYLEAV